MEDHRKHDNHNKKKNNKTMHMPIQIGGMGGGIGIVLLGGALVVATIVSAAAIMKFKTRRLHRRTSSSDSLTADASPKDKELMLKSDQDLSYVDSWPLNLPNPSDWVTSNKEMETKNIQSLTLEEDRNFGSDDDEQVEYSRDSNEDIMFSVVGEDEESTSVYVDSVCESIQVEDSFEKIALDCEEQVVMAAPTELRFPSSDEESCSETLPRDHDGEMLIYNKNHEEVDTISDEAIEMDVEVEDNKEYIIVEDDLRVGDDVAEASENEETVFMDATIEVACVNEVKVEDNPRVQFLAEEKQIVCDDEMIMGNSEGDLSNNTCLTNPIIMEIHQQMQCNNKQVVVMEEEETVKAACVDMVSMEKIHANEVGATTPSQLMNEEEEVQERVTTEDKLLNKKEKEISHTQVIEAAKVDDNATTPSQLMNEEEEEEEVQERVTTKDELLKKKEKEIPHTQVIEAAKVDDNETLVDVVREDNPQRQLMIKQEKIEMINVEDEMPLVQPIQEQDVTEVSSDELQDYSMQQEEEPTLVSNMNNQNDGSDHKYNGTSIKNDSDIKSEPWNLKLWSWSVFIFIWCLCHWYSELPYTELSLVASCFFFLILLATYFVNYE